MCSIYSILNVIHSERNKPLKHKILGTPVYFLFSFSHCLNTLVKGKIIAEVTTLALFQTLYRWYEVGELTQI